MGIVSTAVNKFRTTLLIMLFCIIAGVLGRAAMPIASNPNISFPWVNVSVFLEGASPEDMARLVAKPIENRMLRLEGQEEIFSVNSQSFTYVRIKYDVDYDIDQAILDVERAVSEIRNQLPPEAEDPRVQEFADNDQPILVYSVYGFANLRSGFYVAKDIQERLEKIPAFLKYPLMEFQKSYWKLKSQAKTGDTRGNSSSDRQCSKVKQCFDTCRFPRYRFREICSGDS